jgi:hypothetical protein
MRSHWRFKGSHFSVVVYFFENSGACNIEFCIIFHACRASRWTISWNSKPPANSGLVISSHDTQHVFLFPPRQPQQKIRNIVFIWWHGPTGGLKHDIEYVGVAYVTYLIKITPCHQRKGVAPTNLGLVSRPYPSYTWMHHSLTAPQLVICSRRSELFS